MDTNEAKDLVTSLDGIARTLEAEARALRSVMSYLSHHFVPSDSPANGG